MTERGQLVITPPDERSALAVAYLWASRIMAVSLEMVLPGVAGYLIDRQAGVEPVFTVVGFGSGMTLGIWHLIRMTRSGDGSGDEAGGNPR